MRRRFALMVFATTAIVVAAFLAPLIVLVRETAVDRAMAAGTGDAQNVAALVGVLPDAERIREIVDGYNQGSIRTAVSLPDGSTIGPPFPESDSVTVARSGRALTADTGDGREILVPVETPAGRAVVRTLVPGGVLDRGVPQALAVLSALALGLVLLAVVVADRLARWVLRPVAALAGTAHRLAHGDLAARVRPTGPPELDEVGTALNMLAGRIGELLGREREAVADLSHRLRTPLTALRLEAHGLGNPEESARMVALVGSVERTTNRIIAEARRPGRDVGPAECDAAAVVAGRVAFWTPLAEDQNRRAYLHQVPGSLPVRLAADELAALVDALLENVFAHTPEGTDLAVAVQPWGDGGARVVVEDAGPGLPGVQVTRRGASRSGSTGLGLDIVRRGAEASGGGLTLGRSALGGARVQVDLGPGTRQRVRAGQRQLAARLTCWRCSLAAARNRNASTGQAAFARLACICRWSGTARLGTIG
jgi:signal transduction histidine kinase